MQVTLPRKTAHPDSLFILSCLGSRKTSKQQWRLSTLLKIVYWTNFYHIWILLWKFCYGARPTLLTWLALSATLTMCNPKSSSELIDTIKKIDGVKHPEQCRNDVGYPISWTCCRSDYGTIVKTNWMVWIPFQSVNFTLIPLQHRLMFSNLMALVWNTYLAYKANSQKHIASVRNNITLTENS